jgi:hypothetical protein
MLAPRFHATPASEEADAPVAAKFGNELVFRESSLQAGSVLGKDIDRSMTIRRMLPDCQTYAVYCSDKVQCSSILSSYGILSTQEVSCSISLYQTLMRVLNR